jgi:hypothetical protein
MRRLIASTFASLDGITQAPGGPEEDPTGGFALGGWICAHDDDSVDISTAGFDVPECRAEREGVGPTPKGRE